MAISGHKSVCDFLQFLKFDDLVNLKIYEHILSENGKHFNETYGQLPVVAEEWVFWSFQC